MMLTDAQRELVESPEHLGAVRVIARKFAFGSSLDQFDDRYAQYLSAGYIALCDAARLHKGTAPFLAYARSCIRFGILAEIRRESYRGFSPRNTRKPWDGRHRIESLSVPYGKPEEGGAQPELGDHLLADDDPIGWELEYEDQVHVLTAPLPARDRDSLRARFLRPVTNGARTAA